MSDGAMILGEVAETNLEEVSWSDLSSQQPVHDICQDFNKPTMLPILSFDLLLYFSRSSFS